MAVKYFILTILLLGTCWAQSEPSVKDALDSLPPELQGKVDESQIKAIQNKSTELLKQKCTDNGGPDAFSNLQNSFGTFKQCLENLINVEQVKEEINIATPNGQIDEVFKKYCAKTPQMKDCFRTATESVKQCLVAEEKTNMKTVYNITEQLVDFVCFKEGDRIALFIAEGGPECFQNKSLEIQQCANATIGDEYSMEGLDASNFSTANIPKIEFGTSECSKIRKFHTCVVTVLETCEAPTTGNIVDSLFKYAINATPCKKYEEKAPGSASGVAVTSTALLALALKLAM